MLHNRDVLNTIRDGETTTRFLLERLMSNEFDAVHVGQLLVIGSEYRQRIAGTCTVVTLYI